MILKSLSRKSDSTGQLVNYVMRYVFREKANHEIKNELTEAKPSNSRFIIRHNLRARTSLKSFIREFQENESYRLVKRKDSVRLFHHIMSFSNKDKQQITDELLRDMAKKFIEERGTNNLYLGTKHEEGVDHIHLHIIVSGTQLNGRSSRVSKQKFHSIKLALQKYQQEKYPELTNSLPEHGKKKRLKKENIIEQIKANRQTDKQVLLENLEKIYAAANSKKQFQEQLKAEGYNVYLRAGRVQGIMFNDKKFRLSRLGFDEEKLDALNEPERKQQNVLQDLQQLREQKTMEKKQEMMKPLLQHESVIQTEINRAALDELSAIRNKRGIRDKEVIVETAGFERESIGEQTENTNINCDETEEGVTPLVGGLRHLIRPISIETE